MRCLSAILLGIALTAVARAHHQPGVTIEELTRQIAAHPGMAELYFQRADEYTAMLKWNEAEADLNKSLQLKPDFLPSKRSLARLWQYKGEPAKGLAVLRAAVKNIPEEHQFLLPGCLQLEGELLLDLEKPQEAMVELDAAMKASTLPDAGLLLLRAEAQRRLGKNEERIADLKTAWEKSNAIILRNEWLNALIDAGRGAEALPFVQTELESSRFQSTWRIKRAQIQLQSGKKAEANEDLEYAVAELTTRLASGPQAYTLLADRALAYALLEKWSEAKADAAQARVLGAAPGQVRVLERLLKEHEKTQPAEKNQGRPDSPP